MADTKENTVPKQSQENEEENDDNDDMEFVQRLQSTQQGKVTPFTTATTTTRQQHSKKMAGKNNAPVVVPTDEKDTTASSGQETATGDDDGWTTTSSKKKKAKNPDKRKPQQNTASPECFFFAECKNRAGVDRKTGEVWVYCNPCYQTRRNPNPCPGKNCSGFGRLSDFNPGEFFDKCPKHFNGYSTTQMVDFDWLAVPVERDIARRKLKRRVERVWFLLFLVVVGLMAYYELAGTSIGWTAAIFRVVSLAAGYYTIFKNTGEAFLTWQSDRYLQSLVVRKMRSQKLTPFEERFLQRNGPKMLRKLEAEVEADEEEEEQQEEQGAAPAPPAQRERGHLELDEIQVMKFLQAQQQEEDRLSAAHVAVAREEKSLS